MDVGPRREKFRWLFLLLCIAILTSSLLFCLKTKLTFIGPSGISSTSLTPATVISALPTPTTVTSTLPTPIPTSVQFPGTTPEYKPFKALLKKVIAIGPVYVTGDSSVPDTALQAAGTILATMLQHRPDSGLLLRENGTFSAVSSRTERICDLPYFAGFNSTICNAYGEGGAGGVLGYPITACDEKNLLEESDDPYHRYHQHRQGSNSQNICVHELAHTIMDVGLSWGRERAHPSAFCSRTTGGTLARRLRYD